MFVDKVQVKVKAGDGGYGIASFRHEKFIDKGGPDGGDGGDGGDVIFEASRNQDTLTSFRYQKRIEALAGTAGSKRKKHGKSGSDLIIQVPVGTVIANETGETIADLTTDGERAIVARGGKGGFGNAHFVSSRRQAPRIAERGEKGEELELTLELKMIADVGLVGLPNAGKSTFLASISNARPEIADYPFTTLRPNLGMTDINGNTSLLFADIPGLIAGASQGKGLGDDFLRHLERTQVLVHLIDIYNDSVKAAYQTIQEELKAYKVDLTKRPQLVVLTKIDGLDADIVADKIKELKRVVPKGSQVFAASAVSKTGMQTLLRAISQVVTKERKKQSGLKDKLADKGIPVLTLDTDDGWQVERKENGFVVTGKKIENFAARTDFDSYHAVERLRDIMRKMGIMHELARQGVEPGDKINISNHGSIKF